MFVVIKLAPKVGVLIKYSNMEELTTSRNLGGSGKLFMSKGKIKQNSKERTVSELVKEKPAFTFKPDHVAAYWSSQQTY